MVEPAVGGHGFVEGCFTRVAEGWMAEVVPKCDRFGQGLVRLEGGCEAARDLGCFERVGQSCTKVIVMRRSEHLRLAFEPPERSAFDDTMPVELKGVPQWIIGFVLHPPTGIA